MRYRTNNLIDDLIDPSVLSEDTRMVLVSAMYFLVSYFIILQFHEVFPTVRQWRHTYTYGGAKNLKISIAILYKSTFLKYLLFRAHLFFYKYVRFKKKKKFSPKILDTNKHETITIFKKNTILFIFREIGFIHSMQMKLNPKTSTMERVMMMFYPYRQCVNRKDFCMQKVKI